MTTTLIVLAVAIAPLSLFTTAIATLALHDDRQTMFSILLAVAYVMIFAALWCAYLAGGAP